MGVLAVNPTFLFYSNSNPNSNPHPYPLLLKDLLESESGEMLNSDMETPLSMNSLSMAPALSPNRFVIEDVHQHYILLHNACT